MNNLTFSSHLFFLNKNFILFSIYITLTVQVVFNVLNAIHMLYLLMDHANIVQHIQLGAKHVNLKILQFIVLSVIVVIIILKEVVCLVKLQVEYAMHVIILMDIVQHAPRPQVQAIQLIIYLLVIIAIHAAKKFQIVSLV